MQDVPQPGSLDAEAGIFCSTFDQTGTRLITGGADKTIKVRFGGSRREKGRWLTSVLMPCRCMDRWHSGGLFGRVGICINVVLSKLSAPSRGHISLLAAMARCEGPRAR